MEDLKKLFENIEKIAIAMEKIANTSETVEKLANVFMEVADTLDGEEELTQEQLEKLSKSPAVQEMMKQVATAPAVPIQAPAANIQMPVQAPVATNVIPKQANVAPVQPQIPVPQAQVAVPVSQNVESFTQDQIARALANATSIGRADIVKNIFTTFGVQTLMEINPANYNKIATMLREAGIQI